MAFVAVLRAVVRPDREDITAQRAAVQAARAELADALEYLADVSLDAAKVARSQAKRPPAVDLARVHGWRVVVEQCENNLDTCLYDLHTAAGGDG